MIPRSELKIDFYRATGNGGQNVNKVSSAVRLTHIPTGHVVTCQDERSQKQNLDRAMATLEAWLDEQKAAKRKAQFDQLRQDQLGSGRVRTYDFTKNRVTDHRRGTSTTKVREVMDGNLDLLLS